MKERLNWIDALRGFTMFSVVAVHVLTFGVGINPEESVVCVIRGAFTLPLFFIISGFFLYRPAEEWTRERIIRSTRVRFVAMVLGAIIFSLLLDSCIDRKHLFAWLYNGYFDRYWFTPTLFQMYLYYLVVVEFSKLCKRDFLILFFILSIITTTIVCFIPALDKEFWSNWLVNKHTVIYLPYFIFGMLFRKYENFLLGILMKPWTLTVLIIVFITGCSMSLNASGWRDEYKFIIKIAYSFIGRLAGALLVINIFYYNKDYFDGDGRFVRYWRKIGTRTLDIYYLHYFLIPNIRWIHPYIKKGVPVLQELLIACVTAALITVICVALSNLLRRAPLIRNLLGAK